MNSSGIQPFSEVLRNFRERKRPKISQQKLADALHVNRQTVVAWERGDNTPKDRTRVLEIAKYLHLNDGETNELLQAALLDPLPLWNVPFHRNLFFTGRDDILQELHNTLISGMAIALTQPQAISGLGGIGKTHTAIEYAYRYRGEYSAVLWVQAASREVLFSEFVKLGQFLNLSGLHEKDQNQIVSGVKRWLKMHKGWLLIFDNIEDLLLIEDFLPSNHQGCVLLTTRVSATEPIASAIELGKMAEKEAILFLLRRIKILTADTPINQVSQEYYTLAKKIWRFMDGLPLAIDQAGAYILETQCGLTRYLDLFQRRRTHLLNMRGKFPSGHPESVWTTFSLAFEKVEQLNVVAADILRIISLCNPEAIPEELFSEGGAYLGLSLQMLLPDPLVLDQAMSVLCSYSLVHRDATTRTLTVHRLVQAVLLNMMSKDIQCQWAERIVRATNEIYPDIDEDPRWLYWPEGLLQRYLPHVTICIDLINRYALQFAEASDLLYRTGSHLYEKSQYTEGVYDNFQYELAEVFHKAALAICEQIYHSDDVHTAAVLHSYACLVGRRRKYKQAEDLFLRALRIYQLLQGPDHFDTANTIYELGRNYAMQGEHSQAENFYSQALAIFEKNFGFEVQITNEVANNLSLLYVFLGRYGEAEKVLQRAIDRQEKAFNEWNQAESLQRQASIMLEKTSDTEAQIAARELLHKSFEIRGKAGFVDFDTLGHMFRSLAIVYHKQDRYERAEKYYLLSLACYKKITTIVMGGEPQLENPSGQTPSAAETLCALAELYYDQNLYDQAKPLLEQALEICERMSGRSPYKIFLMQKIEKLSVGFSQETYHTL